MRGVRESFKNILSVSGDDMDLTKGGQEGLIKILEAHYDMTITDILVPEINGAELIFQAKVGRL